jgi:DNA repair protein RecO (recombination protein O)
MQEKTRGIVLNMVKYSDSLSIAHIYTEHSGRVSVMVRHSKSRKSVSKKSILQPLFLLEMQINKKQNREIQYASEISNSPIFHDIPFNVNKSTIAFFIAEVMTKVLKEEEPNPAMFSYLFNTIQLLDHLERGTGNFHLVFMYELSRFLGFYPVDNYSGENKYFNLRKGCFTPFPDISEISLDERLSKELFLVKEKGFKSISTIELTRVQKQLMLDALLKYYHYHLPEMGQIKSLEILKEIFDA